MWGGCPLLPSFPAYADDIGCPTAGWAQCDLQEMQQHDAELPLPDGCDSGLGSHRSHGRGLSCPCLCVHPLPRHQALRPQRCCFICHRIFPMPPALFGHLCSALPLDEPRAPGGRLQAWAAFICSSSAYLGNAAILCSLPQPVLLSSHHGAPGPAPNRSEGKPAQPRNGGFFLLGGAAAGCWLISFSQIRSGRSKEMENSARVCFVMEGTSRARTDTSLLWLHSLLVAFRAECENSSLYIQSLLIQF